MVIKDGGDFTKEVSNWQVGSKVLLEGPYTNFPKLAKLRSNSLLIAGGIGITAFISLIEKALAEDSDHLLVLLWSVSYEKELFYLARLEILARKHPNFYFKLFVTREANSRFNKKRISKDSIQKHVAKFEKQKVEVALSANFSMTNSLIKELKSLDFDKKNIHSNSFLF